MPETNVTRIGLDSAKNVFDVHGLDAHEHVVLSKTVRQPKLLSAKLPLPSTLPLGVAACAPVRVPIALAHSGADMRIVAFISAPPDSANSHSDRQTSKRTAVSTPAE